MAVVQLEQVTRRYQDVNALDNLSLTINEGEVIGLFGHNGAGKTTTMKLILGLTLPSSGEITVLGFRPGSREFNPVRFDIGFLPENVSFYPQLTGLEVLHYFARLKRVSRKQCPALLEQVGLSYAARRKVKTYSKGMRQRLGLAQAVLTTPRLLLLDEPTTGLDPVATGDFYQMIDKLRQQGCSIILSSHVLPGLEKHIDRAAVLNRGKLLAFGTLNELREQAHLPVKILLRGETGQPQLSQEIAAHTFSSSSINGHTVQFMAKESDKMMLLREITQMPDVADIDIQLPTLAQLYLHLMDQTATTYAAKEELS